MTGQSKVGATIAVALLLLSGCAGSGLFIMTPFDVIGAPVVYDDAAFTSRLSVAAVSMASAPDDKTANLAAMATLVATVKQEHPDTQVVVFGELILGLLYDPNHPAAYQRQIAESIPGSSTDFVAALSALYQTVIVFGMAEVDGQSYYNSQAIVFPDGTVMKYRKRGLNSADIAAGFQKGDGMVNAEIGGIPVTFMICSDYQDAQVIKKVAQSGAKAVLMSLGNATRLSRENDYIAREVNKWIVHANRFDASLGISGFSYVADPVGAFRSQVTGDSVYAYYSLGINQ